MIASQINKQKNKKWLSLQESWVSIFFFIFDAWTFLILLVAIFTIIVIFKIPDDPLLRTFFAIISILSSAFVGAKFIRFYEIRQIKQKGYLTVRKMILFFNDLARCEKRIEIFLRPDVENGLSKAHMEEIKDRINSLQEHTIESIKSWADVLPDADPIAKINELLYLTPLKSMVEKEKSRIEMQIQHANDKNEITELKSKLKKQIKYLQQLEDYTEKQSKIFNSGLLSSLSLNNSFLSAAGNQFITQSTPKICSKCANPYISITPGLDKGVCLQCDSAAKPE